MSARRILCFILFMIGTPICLLAMIPFIIVAIPCIMWSILYDTDIIDFDPISWWIDFVKRLEAGHG